MATTPTICN
ncbi:uncharacterized protein FFE2_16075 [Fusarium fujikuroi]|nr:uncharacterized protein FFE2_16075 [Fusarium fujikuroi]